MSGHRGSGGDLGMVHRDLVDDRQVGTWEGGAGLVEILAEAAESATVEWDVRCVEGDHDAVEVSMHHAGEVGEGAEQGAAVMKVGIVGEKTVEQPLLSVVGGDLDAIDDRLLLQAQDLALSGQLLTLGVGYQAGAVVGLGGVAQELVEPEVLAHVLEEVLLPPADEDAAGDLDRSHLVEAGQDGDLVAVGGAYDDAPPGPAARDGDDVL